MWYNLKVHWLNMSQCYLDNLGVSTKLFTVPNIFLEILEEEEE